MTIGYGNWISLHSTSVFASQCTVLLDSFGVCRHVGRRVVLEVWERRSLWDVTNWYKLAQKSQKHLIWIWPRILETSRVMHELQKRANLWFTLSISELGVLLTWCHLLDDKKELRTDWTDFFGLLKKIAILQHKIASGITTTNYHNYHHHQLAEVLFSGSWQPWRVSAVQVLQHFSCPLSNQRPWNSQGHHWPCLMDIHKLKNRLEKNVMISYDFFKAI